MPTTTLAQPFLVYLLVATAVWIICIVIFYLIIKSAVRNGTIEAHQKMGTDGRAYEAPHGR